jgi:hypothetical protein
MRAPEKAKVWLKQLLGRCVKGVSSADEGQAPLLLGSNRTVYREVWQGQKINCKPAQ